MIQFNPTDKITVDVPLFIRLLEYAREDAKTDMDLHTVAENILELSKTGKTLTMNQYDSIIKNQQTMDEIKRMQQLAGISTKSVINEINDTQVMRKVDAALKAGQTVTVQGKPIQKINTMSGTITLKDENTTIDYLDLKDPIADILIDGNTIKLEPTKEFPADKRTPKEKEIDKQAWQSRFGPGGGYDVPSGAKYTGD